MTKGKNAMPLKSYLILWGLKIVTWVIDKLLRFKHDKHQKYTIKCITTSCWKK